VYSFLLPQLLPVADAPVDDGIPLETLGLLSRIAQSVVVLEEVTSVFVDAPRRLAWLLEFGSSCFVILELQF
jgi:hypothetical protein